jgi:poly(A) polymerase
MWMPPKAEALVDLALALASGGVERPEPSMTEALRRELGRFVPTSGEAAGALLGALDRLLVHPNAPEALDILRDWGLVRLWLPEVAAMDGLHLSAPARFAHKDLWAHTRQVLVQCPAEPDLRWVALCHDIGKAATRAFDADGVTFWRHEAVGAWLFRGLGARLGMAPPRIDRIAFVMGHHGRTNQYSASWSDRAIRRLARECGDHLPAMIAFSRADWSTKKTNRVRGIQAGLDALEARLAALRTDPRAEGSLEGLPDALLALSGEAAGPWLGAALRWARAARASGALGDGTAQALAEQVLSGWRAAVSGGAGPVAQNG